MSGVDMPDLVDPAIGGGQARVWLSKLETGP